MAKRKRPQPSALPSSPAGAPPAARTAPWQWFAVLGLLAVAVLLMFGGTLWSGDDTVLSNGKGDIAQEYVHWRAFGFSEMQKGHLLLWNPHVFSGTPFFSGFQAALLYPLNALFLVLPLAPAINWSVALHVFLCGAFMCWWMARRGLLPPAAFLAAFIYMFCGANFLHVYGGGLSLLCSVAWLPLLFLAVDEVFRAPALRWCLAGMFAVAMLVLAGNPQMFYYAGLATAVYGALCLARPGGGRIRVAGCLAAIAAGGILLGAVQLLAGLQEWNEMLRNGGLSYADARTFYFPPQNLLTLLAPDFFGTAAGAGYWGRWYYWETSLFIGVSGLVLAVLGAVQGDAKLRRFSVTMALLAVVLALGDSTPLFKLLYSVVPGFDRFRGVSKFIELASLFLAVLAGVGLDGLLKDRRPRSGFAISVAVLGGIVLVAGLMLDKSPDGISAMMQGVAGSGETYLSPAKYSDSAFTGLAAHLAAQSLVIGGALLVVSALLVGFARQRAALWLLPVLTVAELFIFDRHSLDTFHLKDSTSPAVQKYLADHPGDYRILNLDNLDSASSLGAYDLWGYEPGILSRYAQLIGYTQGVNPDNPEVYVPFSHGTPVFSLFRCRAIFIPGPGGLDIREDNHYLPHLLLVQNFRVLRGRDDIFAALTGTTFNPRQEAILESDPAPVPASSGDSGTVNLRDSTTDSLTIEADVKSPSLLLVTDNYARGWRARALPGSAQSSYQVMPADWCLRAVPLAAGHHLLRLEYAPKGFEVGKWISIVSAAGFLTLAGVCVARRKRA